MLLRTVMFCPAVVGTKITAGANPSLFFKWETTVSAEEPESSIASTSKLSVVGDHVPLALVGPAAAPRRAESETPRWT